MKMFLITFILSGNLYSFIFDINPNNKMSFLSTKYNTCDLVVYNIKRLNLSCNNLEVIKNIITYMNCESP